MERRKRGKIAAAVSFKVPQRVALVFPAFDCWQITIIVGNCPGCVVRLNRFRGPYIRLVTITACFVTNGSLPVEPEE